MKKINTLLLTTLASLTSIAKADDDFHFRLGHNVLLHTWTQSKADGETYRESSTETFKGGWELYAYGQGLNFYFYPGQEGSSVIFGYSVVPELELGLGVSLKTFSRDKEVSDDLGKEDRISSTFSPYATRYVSLGEKETLELTVSPSFTQSRAKITGADGSSTTTKDHGTAWTATALLDRKLGTAWHYYGSLAFVQSKFKGQDTQNQILFVPFGVRYDLR